MARIQPKVQGGERDDGLRKRVIAVNHVTKVVKGGRILGFAILAVVGDGDGRIGVGRGKAKEVPATIQKAMDKARRKIVRVSLKSSTLQHGVVGKHGAVKVQMTPAKDGTDMITSDSIRAIFEMMGVTNIVTKSYGSTNLYNMVHATLDGLHKISTPAEVTAKRGKPVEKTLS